MARRRGTTSTGWKLSNEVVDKIWDKGKSVPGKDPNLYREDSVGNIIYKPSYGKGSPMGWEVDHKRPVDKEGTENLRSLQPLQTDENKEKGNQYPWKPKR